MFEPSHDEEDARAVCRMYFAHRALGCQITPGPGCIAVRQDVGSLVYDVNHVQIAGEADPEAVLEFAEETFSDRPYRQVFVTPFTSPALVARLAHEGFEPDPHLIGLLKGELRGPAPADMQSPVTVQFNGCFVFASILVYLFGLMTHCSVHRLTLGLFSRFTVAIGGGAFTIHMYRTYNTKRALSRCGDVAR